MRKTIYILSSLNPFLKEMRALYCEKRDYYLKIIQYEVSVKLNIVIVQKV